MRKSITLRAFPAQMGMAARLRLARDAGYEGVEVNLEPEEEYTLEASDEALLGLRRQVEGFGLQVSSVYSRTQWLNPITSQNAETRGRGKAIILALAHAAACLGTDAVLVVPGAVDNSIFCKEPEIVPYDVAYETAQGVMRELAAEMKGFPGVHLLVENVWNKFLLSPLEFARFVDEIDHPQVGVYFDVGNILHTGYPEHWIRILGRRIQRVHFKDFRLAVDNEHGFVTLLEGDVNWPAVCEALAAIGYDSWVAAEVLPAYRYFGAELIYELRRKMDVILRTVGG